jgi:hypothetical protein
VSSLICAFRHVLWPPSLRSKRGPSFARCLGQLAVAAEGDLYAWGTCHKGMLGNMRKKTLCAKGDCLLPYKVHAESRESLLFRIAAVARCI